MGTLTRGRTAPSTFHHRAAVLATVAVLGLLTPGQPPAHAGDPQKTARPSPNRAVPEVRPVPLHPSFSDPPTDLEISRARIFEEPLLPVGPTTGDDNRALATALSAYLSAGGGEHAEALDELLKRRPDSPWAPSLHTNLGIVAFRTGYWTRALDHWETAWDRAKRFTEPPTSAIADRAVGELALLNARLGRFERLEALFAEIERLGRDVGGSAGEMLAGARQGLWTMRNRPEIGFKCGPYGIGNLVTATNPAADVNIAVQDYPSTLRGTSLLENRDLAHDLGLELQAAFRESTDGEIVVAALVHWKAGHFAALMDSREGRVLIKDPTFGTETWISRAALDDQTSGYYLVPAGALPTGWRPVDDAEAATVWGKGSTNQSNTDNQKPCDHQSGGCGDMCPRQQCCPKGMATYSFHTMLVALHITDTPVGYSPPVGPGVDFTVAYHQREIFQPQTFFFSNFGPKWTSNWISWVEDDPTDTVQAVAVYQRGGGREVFTGYNPGTGEFSPHYQSRAVAVRTSADPIEYEVRWPDGSVDVYAQPDGALAFPRKVLMTRTLDPQGNAVDLTWDAQLRLVAITDAIGQVTSIHYEVPGDPLKITRVDDPFGRSATFDYEDGRLSSITDVIGLESSFEYGAGDFVTAMTTPYGTTAFETFDEGRQRWLVATDPLGGRERLEYVDTNFEALDRFGDDIEEQIPYTIPAEEFPDGYPVIVKQNLNHRNTFFWSKLAMARSPEQYSRARLIHWLHDAEYTTTAGVFENEKQPEEGTRTFYRYPNDKLQQTGSHATPRWVGRVLDDGSSQIWQYEYSSAGKKTRAIDPLGRETVYVYGTGSTPDANPTTGRGIDLLEIRQKNGESWDTLETRTYNDRHLPLTVTDAAGQTTTYTYNDAGQLLTVSTPERAGITENRTTTYAYDADGYLESVTAPAPGATMGFTYDGFGRLRTVTSSDGDTVTYDYDAMDRVTKVTYPDGTYEETVYDKLDPVKRRDRLGRWTETFYNALRQVELVRDAEGRTVTYQWCDCGALDAIVDANGNRTWWERDVQGRVTAEHRADGAVFSYDYEPASGRLASMTDANGQTTRYAYNLDDTLESITYEDAIIATPGVSYTYDPVYNRVESMTDGIGTTTYDHYPVGVLGAGQLAAVDGPLTDDTVAYTYDELGRVVERGLTTFPTSTAYDELGRITTVGSSVGDFIWTFDGVTSRPETLTYPNGQTTTYTYLDGLEDRRLDTIRHEAPDDSLLSEFAYTYDAVGNIATWRQQWAPDPPQRYTFGYDRVDQLTSAVLTTTDPVPALLKRYAYTYDPLGNRTAYQEDDAVTAGTFNARNQLVSSAPGGSLLFKGTLDEAATVTVDGRPAEVAADGTFAGRADVAEGTDTVEITAVDPSGNARTAVYEVSQSGDATSYTYDANGNMTSDGTRTYHWDAANRLVRVTEGPTEIVAFAYDGQGRRVTKTSGGVTRTYLYDAEDIVEERVTEGETYRYIHGPGIDHPLARLKSGSMEVFYLSDHLGSIVQETDISSSVVTTRGYSPYGFPEGGMQNGGYSYTGREWDQENGLYFYRARYYDPGISRFLSEDPIGINEGPNRYQYVSGQPIKFVDPQGFMASDESKPPNTNSPKPKPRIHHRPRHTLPFVNNLCNEDETLVFWDYIDANPFIASGREKYDEWERAFMDECMESEHGRDYRAHVDPRIPNVSGLSWKTPIGLGLCCEKCRE